MELKNGEKLEDLGYKGLQIIQSANEYRFTTDAVLLANFCRDLSGKSVVDLGAGSGIISILLAAKKNAKRVVGVELQSQLANMAQRSVEICRLEDKVEIVNLPMQGVEKEIGTNFDAVVCNPPYRKVGSGESQLAPNVALCRHEIAVTLQEVVQTAAALLNNKGQLYLVHQANRLAEICWLMKNFGVEPKEIQPVSPSVGKTPNLVIVRGVKGGNVDCTVNLPIFVTDEKGEYTPLVRTYYFTKE